jgi:hypothetical protein
VEALWTRHLRGTGLEFAPSLARPEVVGLYEAVVPPGKAEVVALEAATTDTYDVISSTTIQAVRREAQLVERLQRVLEAAGHQVRRYRILMSDGRYLYTDIADLTENILWEAKGVVTREAIRIAIGQLLDYRRFIQPRPRLAVLLPERPDPDLEQLLLTVDVAVWFEDGEDFVHG